MAVSLLLVFTQLSILPFTAIALGTTAQVIGQVTFSVSYVVVIVRSRLASLGPEYEEAARDLGANARQSLQHALYLQPDFVLAHFGLGNLARSRGSIAESNRHFANALSLLRSYLPEDPLPQSDGLTAGRLEEILTSLIALELAG